MMHVRSNGNGLSLERATNYEENKFESCKGNHDLPIGVYDCSIWYIPSFLLPPLLCSILLAVRPCKASATLPTSTLSSECKLPHHWHLTVLSCQARSQPLAIGQAYCLPLRLLCCWLDHFSYPRSLLDSNGFSLYWTFCPIITAFDCLR